VEHKRKSGKNEGEAGKRTSPFVFYTLLLAIFFACAHTPLSERLEQARLTRDASIGTQLFQLTLSESLRDKTAR